MKKAKFKNSIFDILLIVNQTFYKLILLLANQIVLMLCIFINQMSDISEVFKNFENPRFSGGYAEKLQTFTRHFFR